MEVRTVMLGLAPLLLAACGGKLDANARNFGAAIEQSLQEHGHQCLGMVRWPLQVPKEDGRASFYPPDLPVRLAALQAAGLVVATDTEVEVKSFLSRPGKMKPVVQYMTTEAAKPYLRKPHRPPYVLAPDHPEPIDLCWGRKSVDKVVKWQGPIKFGDYQAADVEYTYKLLDLAPWTHRPDIQKAFGSVKETLDGAGVKVLTRDVHLTSEGWEVKRSLID
jgi:hypothetical protein